MRLLLDECIDVRFRHDIVGHHVETARYAGLATYKNGELLRRAEGRYDVLVTIDKGMQYQQNMQGMSLALVVMRPRSSRIAVLRTLLPELHVALATAKPGQVAIVPAPKP